MLRRSSPPGKLWKSFAGGKTGTYAVPSQVTTIEDQAFRDCVGLTAITVDESHPRYGSLDGVLFNKTLTTLMQYPAGRAGACFLPGSVVSIDPYAFSSCPGLTAFVVEPSNTLYSSLEGSLFNKSGVKLVSVPL